MLSSVFAPALGLLSQADQSRGTPNRFAKQRTTSRSTSSGSSSPTNASATSTTSPPVSPEYNHASVGIPDYIYPAPFVVSNTFVSAPTDRQPSLDDFLQLREVHSCPTSAIAPPPGLEHVAERSPVLIPAGPMLWPRTMSGEGLEMLMLAGGIDAAASPMLARPPRWPSTMSEDALEQMIGASARMSAAASAAAIFTRGAASPAPASSGAVPPPPVATAPLFEHSAMPPPPMATLVPIDSEPQVLHLSEALSVPSVDTGIPTIGSAGHMSGTCKPCAFLHTKGCNNGFACSFCHLCDAGEKQRRKKEKKEVLRDVRQRTMVGLLGTRCV